MRAITFIWDVVFSTVRDVLPIVAIIAFFQLFVLRARITNWPKLLWGFLFVVLGLAFFLMGLELALFPLGSAMAEQLTSPEFLGVNPAQALGQGAAPPSWAAYHWTYVFAFLIAFGTTIAEPSLIAVSLKAQEVSAGSIGARKLRIAVAFGAGIGVALGTFRIVAGVPLPAFIIPGYAIVVVQTFFAPKHIIPVAYDSGGVTTSTVTVPIVTALGLGLATNIPGRSPIVDGFGLIAIAALFPVITVMAYAQLAQWWSTRLPSSRRDRA